MAAVFGTGALLLLPVLLVAPSGDLLRGQGLALVVYLGRFPLAPLRRGLEYCWTPTSTLDAGRFSSAKALGGADRSASDRVSRPPRGGAGPGPACAASAPLDPPARRPRERVAEAPA